MEGILPSPNLGPYSPSHHQGANPEQPFALPSKTGGEGGPRFPSSKKPWPPSPFPSCASRLHRQSGWQVGIQGVQPTVSHVCSQGVQSWVGSQV